MCYYCSCSVFQGGVSHLPSCDLIEKWEITGKNLFAHVYLHIQVPTCKCITSFFLIHEANRFHLWPGRRWDGEGVSHLPKEFALSSSLPHFQLMCAAVKLLYLWCLSGTDPFVLILNRSQIFKWEVSFKTGNICIYTSGPGNATHHSRVNVVQEKSSRAIYWPWLSLPLFFLLRYPTSLIPRCREASSGDQRVLIS